VCVCVCVCVLPYNVSSSEAEASAEEAGDLVEESEAVAVAPLVVQAAL